MFCEPLEARRLLSVVRQQGNLSSLTATQSGSGTLQIKATAAMQIVVFEAGSRADSRTTDFPDGILYDLFGPGTVGVVDLTTGSEVDFGGVNTAKPISIQGGAGGGANFVQFFGITHAAYMNLGGGPNGVEFEDEGDGGSTIICGGGNNNIFDLFSHHAVIQVGGGSNNIFVNTETLPDILVTGTTTNGTVTYDNSSVIDPTIELGDPSADLVTVIAGGGTNNIWMFAGNLKIKTGGGLDTLNTGVDGISIVDVLSQSGINVDNTFQVF